MGYTHRRMEDSGSELDLMNYVELSQEVTEEMNINLLSNIVLVIFLWRKWLPFANFVHLPEAKLKDFGLVLLKKEIWK